MKALDDLSREELVNVLYNSFGADVYAKTAECASCGDSKDAKYYYICDNCEKRLANDSGSS